jgi:hypothetical protein
MTWPLTHLDELAVDGSVAARDLENHRFDCAWGNATFELAWEPSARLTAVSDHLGGLAAVTEAEGVVLSVATLSRPALEGLGALHWLYEPGIDIRERVRRRYGLRLQSLGEQHAIARTLGASARDQMAQKVLDVRASAHRFGYRYVYAASRFKGQPGGRYLDRRVPSGTRLISDVIEHGDQQKLGPLVHRVTSAVLHGQVHGLLPFVQEHEPGPTPGVGVAAIGVSLPFYATLTGAVVLASNQTMLRLCDHFGWSGQQWNDIAQPALALWRRWLSGG